MPNLTNAQKNKLRRIAREVKKQNPYYTLTTLRHHVHLVLPPTSAVTHNNIKNTLTNIWYHNTNF